MTAEERGRELMLIKMGDLPPLALEFGKHLCEELGMCGEVLLTAWTVYAQIVEGLHCTDALYQARACDIEWFTTRVPPINTDERIINIE
jgi:hypothetical protein